MFLQGQNSTVHQHGKILWVNLGKGNYCLGEIVWIIYIWHYAPRASLLVHWAQGCMTHRKVQH